VQSFVANCAIARAFASCGEHRLDSRPDATM
jgi:hypothetical protein